MKYNIVIIGLFLSFSFIGCSDEKLDLPPEDSLSSATFFQSQKDFEQGINGAYAPLRDLYNDPNDDFAGAWAMGELRSDNTHYKFNPNYRALVYVEQIADFMVNDANVVLENKYINNYLIIARANQVLSSIDNVEFDQSVKNNIKGQANFLRALAYFDLVQYFGEIPLHLEPVQDREEAALPLTSVEEIYNQIISDSQLAIELLPLKSQQQPGRATRGAAQMLLSNAYIVNKNWDGAVEVLSSLVESGEYGLLGNYEAVFNLENENSIESIFEVHYIEGTEGLASSFFYEWIPMPLNASQVAEITGVPNSQAATFEGFNIPAPDLINAYEDGDLREEASIAYFNLDGEEFPYIDKFNNPHSIPGLTGTNWPVYRYSEALLFYAEALTEAGDLGMAETYLNQVRSRAGLDPINGLDQNQLKDAIIKERRFELAFENKRWLDLVRTERAVEVMTNYGQKVKSNPENYYYPEGIAPPPSAYSEIKLLFPKPASESLLNPNF